MTQNKQTSTTGILLVQTGTPDAATPQAVKKYLKEFLSDPRVIDTNRWVWFFILNGIILNTRPKKSARLYERLFNKYGPILKIHCESLTKKLQEYFKKNDDRAVTIRYGMRYGTPSLRHVFADMVNKEHCRRMLIVPLFPQFSYVTTGSVFDVITESGALFDHPPRLTFMPPFYNAKEYIQSLSQIIRDKMDVADVKPERLVLSYHGLPQRFINEGDPYFDMCTETTKLLCENINLPKERIIQSFQSRFDTTDWLKPYTNTTLTALAGQGIRHVLVACPSFTMDCLETLDEINIEYKKTFTQNGGRQLDLAACLNDHDHWVFNLAEIIKRELNKQENLSD
ncbi:MAG: ferrochelatase [Deltaproteobacteria bacterium]|nr:ferrochelatase [Deltaproteobacteria bacterium]